MHVHLTDILIHNKTDKFTRFAQNTVLSVPGVACTLTRKALGTETPQRYLLLQNTETKKPQRVEKQDPLQSLWKSPTSRHLRSKW